MPAQHGGADDGSRRTKKRALVVVAALLAASGVGSLAFAYWTQSGTGTGTGSTATTAATDITLSGGSAATAVGPGGSVPLSGTVTNNNASSTLRVSGISATVSLPAGTPTSTCDPAWYSVTGPAKFGTGATSTVDLASGASSSWAGLTLAMTNASVSQDGCKGLALTINYTTS